MEDKPKKKKGGFMPGGGRPKGSKGKTTIEREQALKEFQDGVTRRAKTLMNVQSMLAFGTIKIFRIDTETVGKGKNKKTIKKRPVLVESEEEIINVLDYEYGQGDNPNDDEVYYFVTTKDPENKAIDSLLDRTFGKPKENLTVKHEGLSLKKLYELSKEVE